MVGYVLVLMVSFVGVGGVVGAAAGSSPAGVDFAVTLPSAGGSCVFDDGVGRPGVCGSFQCFPHEVVTLESDLVRVGE